MWVDERGEGKNVDQEKGLLDKDYRNRRGKDFISLIVLSLGLFITISLSIGSPQG
jgi:hypothetical protein